ncbi:MAG: GDSL-type esterase/lipase family protein [Woeseiaceae bacterium]
MPLTRKFMLLGGLVLLASCSTGEFYPQVGADNPAIRYTGRWNFDDPSAPWVGWQGSTVSVAFRGSGISATVNFGDEAETLRVIIDGVPEEPARRVPGGEQTIVLATDLDPTVEHTVTLMKEEYATSNLSFHGFTLADGGVTDLPPRPSMRIAFFGDSNMEGFSLYNEKNNGGNGTYFAYPATVTRMLGAEMQLQAVGSATLDGPTANDVVSFVSSEAYDREDSAYTDDFKPQVIVVNAGANDISRVAEAERKETTKQHYRNAITALRRAYGEEPHIVLWNSYGWSPDEPALYNQEVVDEIGGNLTKADFAWCWEQWHGDMVDHSGQAGRLARHIVSLDLGFSLQQGLDVVDGYGDGIGVANGSFEGSARDGYGGFGWRYYEDGVERVMIDDAAEGDYVIRLAENELVHQCTDTTAGSAKPSSGSQRIQVTAAVRGVGDSGTAVLAANYSVQNLYARENLEEHEFEVGPEWQDYAATFTVPDGTWQTYVILKSVAGELEFDDIRVNQALD